MRNMKNYIRKIQKKYKNTKIQNLKNKALKPFEAKKQSVKQDIYMYVYSIYIYIYSIYVCIP